MKSNLLLKVWGIVLTVAILSGLLMVSVPVAAADSSYSALTTPKLQTANTNVSFLVAAADGQTMFIYSNSAASTLTAGTGVAASYTLLYGGPNTITVTTAGTFTLTLGAGASATVAAGTAAGFTYVAPTITTTGVGTFTVTISGNKLYKSTNAGKSFAGAAPTAPNGLDGNIVVAMAISPNYATDNTLLVGTANNALFLSTNGGATFVNAFGFAAGAGESISSVAVYGQNMIVGTSKAAYAGTVYLFSPVSYTWTNQVGSGTLVAGNAIAVAFSPLFVADAQVFAVVAESGTLTTVNNKIIATGSTWGGSYLKGSITTTAVAPTNAVIAFGADYAVYTGSFLVGLFGSDKDDVYRYTAVANAVGATNTPTDLNVGGTSTPNTSVWSLSIKGNLSDAVYVGTGTSIRKGVAAGVSPTWTAPTVKAFTGTSPIVIATNDAIYVGTSGGAFLSAFQFSTDDLVTFNTRSQISVASTNMTLKNMAIVDANTIFLDMNNAATGELVFKTTDGGATWLCINSNATDTYLGVYVSPAYATDSTVYIPVTTISVLKSVNGGSTFTTQAVGNPGGTITAFAALDGTTYYVGFSGGAVYKSNRFTSFGSTDAAGVNSITLGAANEVFVGTKNGRVFRATDDAITFSTSTVGSLAAVAAHNITVALDPAYATNKTIYYSDSGATGVWSFVIGTSSAWLNIIPAISPASVVVSSNGQLYTGDAAASGLGLYRSINPKAASAAAAGVSNVDGTYAPLTLTWPSGAVVGLTVNAVTYVAGATPTAAGSNTIYAVATGWAVSATSAYPYAFRILTITDKFITAPTGLAPATTNISINGTKLSWTAVPFAIASPATTYDYRINTDPVLINTTAAINIPSGVTYVIPAAGVITAGNTYYWQVRATTLVAGVGFVTPWSATATFTTKLYEPAPGTGPNAIGTVSPAAGSTITIANGSTAVSPTFNWSAVANVTSYEIKLSSKSDFSDVIDSSVGLTSTVYQTPVKLAPGVYYWEIRGVNGANVGDWLQSAFIVAAPVAPATTAAPVTQPVPTYTINVPTQPVPTYTINVPTSSSSNNTTPAWAWVVIAIGAVLVIAVIVLIARTRRV